MSIKAAGPLSGWHAVYDEFCHTSWRGYAGNWFVVPRGRPEPAAPMLQALRTFRFKDETRRALTHRNIYNAPGVLTPKQRQADGLWEQYWERLPDEQGYSNDFVIREGDLADPSKPLRRLTALTPDAYVGGPPQLPSPAWAPPTWVIELFLRGGDGTRWSFGASFGGASGIPVGDKADPGGADAARYPVFVHVLIQERWAGDVPDSPIDMGAMPFFKPREGRLSSDPSEWLKGGPWAGTRYEARVANANDPAAASAPLSAVEESPLSAFLPPAVLAGHELVLLPDQMYAVIPSAVPFCEGAGAGGEEFVFEFGGLMREGRGLRRVRATYAPGGRASAFSFEALGPA